MIAMGVASSAFAVENVKVDGQLKLWYQTKDVKNSVDQTIGTTDATEADGLFKKDGATGDLVAKLRTTGDLTKKVGFGATLYAVSTMGLENNLVSDEAIGYTSTDGRANSAFLNGSDKMPLWLGEAYITYKAGKTIAKIGRQELNTPLAYSEDWNAAPNTFEAAVLVNQDLPDTTLVAAYVSRGNGYINDGKTNNKTVANGSFYNFHSTFTNAASGVAGQALGGGQNANVAAPGDKGGAYALGFVNTSIPGLTIHPVYYNVLDTANAYWIDLTYKAPYGIKLEGLYASVDPIGGTQTVLDNLKGTAAAPGTSTKTTDGYALKVSGELYGVNLDLAYSNIGKGFMPIGNTATGFKKTKVYTASILSDGYIAGSPDSTGWKLGASTKISMFDIAASYATYKIGKNDGYQTWYNTLDTKTAQGVEFKPSEFDLSVSTKIDEVKVTAYYLNQKEGYKSANTNGYTQDTSAVRVVASIDF